MIPGAACESRWQDGSWGWITHQSTGDENPITVDMWDLFSPQHKIAVKLVKPPVVKWNRIAVEEKVLEDVT